MASNTPSHRTQNEQEASDSETMPLNDITNSERKRLKVFTVSDYKVITQIGKGGFAEVYQVESLKNPGTYYAMKLSKKMPAGTTQEDFDKYPSYSFFMKEWKAYERLDFGRTDKNGVNAGNYGIPKIYEKGVLKLGASGLYPYMIMQLLGPSLSSFIKPGSGFRLEGFVKFGIQIIRSVEFIHIKGLVHRDIKPSNMCMSANLPELRIYMVDMGFAKVAPKKETNYEFDSEDFVGTPDYASENSLRGKLQGYRDDIEQLGYTMLELLLGDLPWSVSVPYGSKSGWSLEQLHQMADKKIEEISNLTRDGFIPEFWTKWMQHVKSLTVFEKPDYRLLEQLIQNVPNEQFKNYFRI